MSVYVDDMRARVGRMIMCHMVGDTDDELHAMADKIGVQRKWFQDTLSGPHYDIALSKRALAIEYGAVAVTTRQLAMMCGNRRDLGSLGQPETAGEIWRARHVARAAERARR